MKDAWDECPANQDKITGELSPFKQALSSTKPRQRLKLKTKLSCFQHGLQLQHLYLSSRRPNWYWLIFHPGDIDDSSEVVTKSLTAISQPCANGTH